MLYPQTIQKKQIPIAVDPGISDTYYRWFEIIPADTPALREEAYRLRYQVYCREHPYENPDEHPQQMELDAYDCRSMHSLIIDRENGLAIGTVRIILPELNSPEASLPVQQICRHSLPIECPMSSTVEISRFAISKEMRKMVEGHPSKELKCSVVLGLMKATVQMSLEYGVTDWLAVMEPALLRLLSRFAIYFAPIGPLIEYHGFRQPCHANVRKMLEAIRQKNFTLWEFLTNSNTPWTAKMAS
jgi:N-acyl amino acid synthase of PEP-CTERM/exosortase system